MKTNIQFALQYVYAKYSNGGSGGFSSIEPLKLIPSLIAYYGENDLSEKLKKDDIALRGLLVKIELVERSIIQIQNIPNEFRCIYRNEDRDPQMPQNFTFAPQINIPEYPSQNIDQNLFERIQSELVAIDIIALLLYIKEKAIASGDFEEAMKI